jgi:hypothetical protein
VSLRRGAVAAIALAACAIAAAYGSVPLTGGTPGWAPWLFVGGIDLLLVALMVLGAARPGRGVGRLAIPFAVTGAILAFGFGALLLLPAADPADPTLWLGLPPRAAVVVYVIGFLPVLFLPLAYALTFDELTLSEADLARARAARTERPEPPR